MNLGRKGRELRTKFVGLMVVLGLLAIACGADATPTRVATPDPTSTQESAAGPAQVPNIHKVSSNSSLKFSPADITVAVGDTVEWTVSGLVHTTTSGRVGDQTGLWNSDTLRLGESFSHTFSEIGEFPYFCRIHGGAMKGSVTVVPAGDAPPASAPGPIKPQGETGEASGGLYDY